MAFFAALTVGYLVGSRAIASKGVVRHFVPPNAARFFGAALEKGKRSQSVNGIDITIITRCFHDPENREAEPPNHS